MGATTSRHNRVLGVDRLLLSPTLTVAGWTPDGVVIGRGENRREVDRDPTAHAEMVALRDAARGRSRWRMDGATVYVTLEPCVMCAGALLNARVERVVIGALDEKAGAVGSRYNVLSDPRLLHEAALTYDVLGDESAALLREFFVVRRP